MKDRGRIKEESGNDDNYLKYFAIKADNIDRLKHTE